MEFVALGRRDADQPQIVLLRAVLHMYRLFGSMVSCLIRLSSKKMKGEDKVTWLECSAIRLGNEPCSVPTFSKGEDQRRHAALPRSGAPTPFAQWLCHSAFLKPEF